MNDLLIWSLYESFYLSEMHIRYLFIILSVLILEMACHSGETRWTSPIKSIRIENGFELKIVAREPLIEAPVAMDFDEKGRIWVLEMKGYMPNIEGSGEDSPVGRISIIEDIDKDGQYDKKNIFLDSLILPRALLLVEHGLLYSEPPNLWYVEIIEDRPGRRRLVDSTYAVGGNVEHQANGLLWNLDNWIYSAKSNKRYRKKGEEWIRDYTSFRGQWGLTKDDQGRLFYNDNSNQFLGDYIHPNMAIANKFLKPEYLVNQTICGDQRVFPLHPSTVNRGYVSGVLDSNQVLINFTSACGPLMYRGGLFPQTFGGNYFVCGPEVNLIKRNLVELKDGKIVGTQAFSNHEWIASYDEGFRPVNLYNGLDGAIYIVDMHRGIIQHKTYMTSYLHDQIEHNKLDTIMGMGRILKILPKGSTGLSVPDFSSLKPEELIQLLFHVNGRIRDKAHQKLLNRKSQKVVEELRSILKKNNDLACIHALWILHDQNNLTLEEILDVGGHASEDVLKQCLRILELWRYKLSLSQEEMVKQFLVKKCQTGKMGLDMYLAHSMGVLFADQNGFVFSYLKKFAQEYDDPVFAEVSFSALSFRETDFISYVGYENFSPQWKLVIDPLLSNLNLKRKNPNLTELINPIAHKTRGFKLYNQYCSSCHGTNGKGIKKLAPPLYNSDYISGDVERLALILLHGLQGPVRVSGNSYLLNSVMPGLQSNEEVTNEDLSALISYVRNAFTSISDGIKPEKIEKLRLKKPRSSDLYTEEELNQLFRNNDN